MMRRFFPSTIRQVGGGGVEPTVDIYSHGHGYTSVDYNPISGLWTRCADTGSLDRIQHSADAITWNNSTYSIEEAWMNVKNRGTARSVMVGRGTNDQRKSDNQTAWVSMALGNNSWGHLAYDGGRWITVGRRSALQVGYSDNDGDTWAYYEVGSSVADGEYLQDVTNHAGLFVWTRGSNGIWTSPTGEIWTQRYSGPATPQGLYSNGTIILSCCVDGTILSSTDAITWTQVGTVDAYTTEGAITNRISGGAGYWIVTRSTTDVGENLYWSFDNGATWAAFTVSIPALPWYRIHFADNKFVAVATQVGAGDIQMIITP